MNALIRFKHWAYQKVWSLIRPTLFWKGDTKKILNDTTSKEKKNEESSQVIIGE